MISLSTFLMISRSTDTIIINPAPDIRKSIDCPINLPSIYGKTAIRARKDQP